MQYSPQESYFFYISWGLSLEKFENFETAQEKIETAIQINQKNNLGFNCLGHIYFKMNKYDLALENFQKSLDIDSKDENAIFKIKF